MDFNNQWNCFQRGYCIEYGIDVLLSGICLSEAAIGCCCRNDLVNADVVFDSVVETDRCKNRNENGLVAGVLIMALGRVVVGIAVVHR